MSNGLDSGIETSNNDRSDDDIFIPVQMYTSSDDENPSTVLPVEHSTTTEIEHEAQAEENSSDAPADEISIDERPDSSEDSSSQAHSSSQENHEFEQEIEREVTPEINAPPDPNNKSKKPRKKKKNNKTKEKEKKDRIDRDMEFLDQCIARNLKDEKSQKRTPVKAKDSELKQRDPQTGKADHLALKKKLREKKEARNSNLELAMEKLKSQPVSIRDQLRTKMRARLSSMDQSEKKNEIGRIRASVLLDLHKQASEISKPATPTRSNMDRTEMLIHKYEQFVADGIMTLDEAIELACLGKDITETDPLPSSSGELFESEAEKNRQMEFYYRAIANMDPQNQGRMPSNIPDVIKNISNELVDYSFESPHYIEMMKNISRVERSINEGIDPDTSLNKGAWLSMCRIMYEKFHDKMQFNTEPPITDPVKFYQEALRNYVVQLMINDLTRLDKSGVFDRYDPAERPLILACFQKHVADLFPSTELVLDMKKVTEAGFVPRGSLSFNPLGPQYTMLAFGLFWSFSCEYNLFIGFFRSPGQGYRYYLINFDRLNEDVTAILERPRKTYKETVTEMVNEEKAVLDFKRELLSVVETGSSETLEHAMTISSDEVLDPSFIKEVGDETGALLLPPDIFKIDQGENSSSSLPLTEVVKASE